MPTHLSFHRLPPILSASLLALLIDCCSNIIAQRIRHWKLSTTTPSTSKLWHPTQPTAQPFVFDRVLFLQFAFMTVILAPLNFLWQNWLEKTFPGWIVVGGGKTSQAGDVMNGKSEGDVEMGEMREGDEGLLGGGSSGRFEEEEVVKKRNWVNIARKWFTDCITLGALFNTTGFIVIMGILKGKSTAQIIFSLRTEMLGIIWDSYKVWPIANFISTTYIPVERRIVFLSGCGLIWNIYLSLVAARL